MRPEEIDAIRNAAREASRRSRAEQGLPPKITDRRIIERIAVIIRGAHDDKEAA